MTIDPDLLKSLAESGLLEKVYDDAFAQPVKEVSKIVTWLIKTTQVLCYPLQLGAAYQERLERRIKNAVEKISEENLVKPPESFYVPIVNYLSYIEDGSDLVKLFENLLARGMDKTRNNEAHPAFITLVSQLSPDEAQILTYLKSNQLKITRLFDLIENKFIFNRIEEINFPLEQLFFRDNLDMYLNHLEFMNLICVIGKEPEAIWRSEPERQQIGSRELFTISFTKFGDLFIKACFPSDDV